MANFYLLLSWIDQKDDIELRAVKIDNLDKQINRSSSNLNLNNDGVNSNDNLCNKNVSLQYKPFFL